MKRKLKTAADLALAEAMKITPEDRDVYEEPEQVLPVQWHEQPRHESPELRLAWACFVQGIADLFPGPRLVTAEEGREVVEDAKAWLKSDETHTFSFVSLCDLFGFDADAMRAKLLARIEAGERPRLPRSSESFPQPKRIRAKAA